MKKVFHIILCMAAICCFSSPIFADDTDTTCGEINIVCADNSITIEGPSTRNYKKIELVNITGGIYETTLLCIGDCGYTASVTVADGTYLVKVFDENWEVVCDLPYGTPIEVTGGGVTGSDDIDLSIDISQSVDSPVQYEVYTVEVTVQNTGPDAATGVMVDVPFPAGVVYFGANEYEASQGIFYTYGADNGLWNVGILEGGNSATLSINYFLLETAAPVVYTEVVAANGNDPDSTPDNGGGAVNEDDEASTGEPAAPLGGCFFELRADESIPVPRDHPVTEQGDTYTYFSNSSRVVVDANGEALSVTDYGMEIAPIDSNDPNTDLFDVTDVTSDGFTVTIYDINGAEQNSASFNLAALDAVFVGVTAYKYFGSQFYIAGTYRPATNPVNALPFLVVCDASLELQQLVSGDVFSSGGTGLDLVGVSLEGGDASGNVFLGFSTFSRTYIMAKVASDGNLLWSRTLIGDLVSNEIFSIEFLPDYSAFYFVYELEPSALFDKVDANDGSVIFTRDFSDFSLQPGNGTGLIRAQTDGSIVTGDGGLFIPYYSFEFLSSNPGMDEAARFDADGNLLWVRSMDEFNYSDNMLTDTWFTLLETGDGELVMFRTGTDETQVIQLTADGETTPACLDVPSSPEYAIDTAAPIPATTRLSLIPNPVRLNNDMTLQITKEIAGPTLIRISNVMGQIVFEQTCQLDAGRHDITLPTSRFLVGTYFVMIPGRETVCGQLVIGD